MRYHKYWISTYGRVYNQETGYIVDGHPDVRGYILISFYLNDGNRVFNHIHRVEMLTFVPIDNAEEFVVNHIDGRKYNNRITNLEWVTQKRNVEHAFETGLRKCGEDSSHTVFTNEEVHKVCRCMENGYNLHELSDEVFGRYPDLQIQTLCKNIYSKKFWRHISDNYNISNYKRNGVFSIPEVEKICELIHGNKDIATEEILDYLNIDYSDRSRYEILKRSIRGIRTHKSFREISSRYNI